MMLRVTGIRSAFGESMVADHLASVGFQLGALHRSRARDRNNLPVEGDWPRYYRRNCS